jgi:mono/diheme cytochrome c family protein
MIRNRRSLPSSFGVIAFVLTASAACAAFAGCGDDDSGGGGSTDAGKDSPTADTGPGTDGGTDTGTDAANDPKVKRGEYLVNVVAACADCHTPRTQTGALDMSKFMSGVECFIDLNGPTTAGGCLHTSNLTNDATGLKNRTDQQIKTMFMDGKEPEGRNLNPIMPYWVFHNLEAADADAIVAYLRTLAPVAHTIPPNDPPWNDVPQPATPIDLATLPPAASESAKRGQYLAARAGLCIECHTPETTPPAARPVDMTKPFAGGRAYPTAFLGIPSPPFPAIIYSANITPHPTGMNGATAQDIVKILKQGRDRDGGGVCPPMPVGPMGAYGKLTDEDALDIATYIVGVPPIDNALPNGCTGP